MTQEIHLTPYTDVNAILLEVLSGAQVILGEIFVGMYLSGSLAAGDFAPEKSDIDFLVVTTDELALDMIAALVEMHGRVGAIDTKWAVELEGAYIPLDALRRYDPDNARHPYIDRGEAWLRQEQLETDWIIHRFVLREHGFTIIGPPIRTLIDPISPDDLRKAVFDLLEFWWVPMATDPTRLKHEGYRTYAIMTMCRINYTMKMGDIVSKPMAARWAGQNLDERWAPLIDQALAWPEKALPDNVAEVQDFIRFTHFVAVDYLPNVIDSMGVRS